MKDKTDKSSLNIVVKDLTDARAYAVIAGLDQYFVSDIDHLIATAKANMEEE